MKKSVLVIAGILFSLAFASFISACNEGMDGESHKASSGITGMAIGNISAMSSAGSIFGFIIALLAVVVLILLIILLIKKIMG